MDGSDSHSDGATERLIVQLYEQSSLSPQRNLGALRRCPSVPSACRPSMR
jgi:hypothetical protein